MSIPDYQSLMERVLLKASAGEVSVRSVIEQLGEELGLSESERSLLLASGRKRIFDDRVHWAKSYLTQAGLIELTRRGHFRITERGMRALKSKPARINNAYLSQFQEFRDFVNRKRRSDARSPAVIDTAETGDAVAATVKEGETPDATIRTAHRAIEEALASELLARIRSNSFQFFEQVVVRLLLNMGYGGGVEDAGRTLGRSGDNGVDGVIDQDHLGLDRVYVQAKRYGAEVVVSASEIRDFFGSLDRFRAAKGLFITTSRFSKSARDTAEALSKRIVLIDGDQLARLMIRHNVGVRIEDILHLKKVDEDFFLD
jgi:restriction system protein